MDKKSLILATLASAGDSKYTPVQIQKIFFLIDRQLGKKIGGPFFNFKPYHYGPFDKDLYNQLQELTKEGLVQTNLNPLNSLTKFSLTETGRLKGQKELRRISSKERDFIVTLNAYVRSMTFSQLVASIYKAYPEMKKNSIFTD